MTKAKVLLLIALAGLSSRVANSQSQGKEHKTERGIKKYEIRIIETTSDTVSVNDSVRVRVEMYLDCTNEIIRTETAIDTSGKKKKIRLSVYGKYMTGPYRPMCAARRVVKEVFVYFPEPGNWIIETGEPDDNPHRDSPWIVVVR